MYVRLKLTGGVAVAPSPEPARWDIGPVTTDPMGHRAGSEAARHRLLTGRPGNVKVTVDLTR
jgi:hypothetical protein